MDSLCKIKSYYKAFTALKYKKHCFIPALNSVVCSDLRIILTLFSTSLLFYNALSLFFSFFFSPDKFYMSSHMHFIFGQFSLNNWSQSTQSSKVNDFQTIILDSTLLSVK